MAALFVVLGFAAYGLAGIVFSVAKGAPHEIEALILILVGTVFVLGGAIISEIRELPRALRAERERAPAEPTDDITGMG